MNDLLANPPDPGVPDQPEPLPPARGHGFVAERLLSLNGLISLLMLSWSLLVLRRPALARNAVAYGHHRLPWLFGGPPT